MEQRKCRICRNRMGFTHDKICKDCLELEKTKCPCGCGQLMQMYRKDGKLRRGVNKSHAIKAIRSSDIYGDEWKRKIWKNRDKEPLRSPEKRKLVSEKIKALYRDQDSTFNTDEFRKKRSEATRNQWKRGNLVSPNEETRKKISLSLLSAYKDGRKVPKSSYGKREKVITPYGIKNLRSTWEKVAYNIININFVDWSYESHVFDLVYTTYTPDFYIPVINTFIEIKGYQSPEWKEKYRVFKELYPNIDIVVISAKNKKELYGNIERTLRYLCCL